MEREIWEILVPHSNSAGIAYSIKHHRQWDEFVVNLTGGLTITKVSKGRWISPKDGLFEEQMIPCRIMCSKKDIEKIVDFTLKHYEQLAVLAYKISSDVVLKFKDSNE